MVDKKIEIKKSTQLLNLGRPRNFESPSALWRHFLKFMKSYEDNPLIEVDFKGKDATKVHLPRMRAMSWKAFEGYLGKSVKDYKTKQDFSDIIARIDAIMFSQKFEGAAAGLLNPNLIARELHLADNTNVDLSDQRKSTGDLFPDIEDE